MFGYIEALSLVVIVLPYALGIVTLAAFVAKSVKDAK